MSFELKWTPESEKTFAANSEHLLEEWGIDVLNHFLDRVEEVLENIKSNPKLYPLYRPAENIHRCVIHERVVLYYRIVSEDTIDLLTFWNTYQDPDRLIV